MLSQFKSPIILILIFASGLSFFLRDPVNAGIILSIVFISGLLGFWQERGAADAVEKLLSIVRIKAEVLRDGIQKEIPVEEIVPGDIILFTAGDVVPGDCLIIGSKALFGFTPLPLSFQAFMGGIVVIYIISAEAVKMAFYKKVRF